MKSTVPSKTLRVLHSLFQGLILSLPKVSEGRLAFFLVFKGWGFKLSIESFKKVAGFAPAEPRLFAFDSF